MKVVLSILGILVVVFLALLYFSGKTPSDSDGIIPGGPVEENTPPQEASVGEDVVVNKVKEISSSGRESLSVDQLELVSITKFDWPNACLGIENNEEICAQVITPGYRIVLEVQGSELVYHTDLTGDSVRFKESISLEE